MREKTIREAEACDSRGWTRMTRAAFTGNIGEMKKLLDGGCDVNSQDNMGMTPLHWARTTEMMSYLSTAARILKYATTAACPCLRPQSFMPVMRASRNA